VVHVPLNVAGDRVISLRTRFLIAGLEALSTLAGVLPQAIAEPLCRVAGLIWYAAAPTAREAVHDNLRHILGRQPTARAVARVFQYGALNYWDTFAIPHVNHAALVGLVDVHGAEHIAAARAQGKGVIACTAHLGSVAFVGQIVPALGYSMVGLIEPLASPELFEFFARQRQAQGARLLPISTGALRELVLALRRNEVVGLVTDRDVTGSGPRVPFFDALTQFPDGGAALAVRTGAAIVIAIAIRKAHGRFDALFEPLPPVPMTGDTKQDVLAVTQAIARRLEYHIAKHPEQWTVFQKRWPEGGPGEE
jgi:KDO2-lipid IV(A) lauroyltransferase